MIYEAFLPFACSSVSHLLYGCWAILKMIWEWAVLISQLKLVINGCLPMWWIWWISLQLKWMNIQFVVYSLVNSSIVFGMHVFISEAVNLPNRWLICDSVGAFEIRYRIIVCLGYSFFAPYIVGVMSESFLSTTCCLSPYLRSLVKVCII